jgi:hypothetical protein
VTTPNQEIAGVLLSCCDIDGLWGWTQWIGMINAGGTILLGYLTTWSGLVLVRYQVRIGNKEEAQCFRKVRQRR